LAYVIGIDKLKLIISEPLSQHIGLFSSLLVFTLVFFFVFAWFREQVCLIVCPYGRLQGVMLDKNSIVVAYDHRSGEKRGHFKRGQERSLGDCVDCYQCVRVCPTGIDIRNGTQLECVNCTACIDACDEVMEKVNLPQGLIRYASENQISNNHHKRFTPRVKAYTGLLSLLLMVMVFLFASRSDIDATVLKTQGFLYQRVDSVHYKNLYNISVINKTNKSQPLEFKIKNDQGEIEIVGNAMSLKPESKMTGQFFIKLHKKFIKGRKTKVPMEIHVRGKKIKTLQLQFYSPAYLNPES
jgi:cytochrome c oxidase accessory protein FixG